jgi:hypothetical protein
MVEMNVGVRFQKLLDGLENVPAWSQTVVGKWWTLATSEIVDGFDKGDVVAPKLYCW